MKSLNGPSGKKLVTLKKLDFWLSRGPEFVATAYLRISFPVLVACSSGVSANLPTMIIFANEFRAAEVEKERALAVNARRARNDDIFAISGKFSVSIDL
jgi:hypothetical protein